MDIRHYLTSYFQRPQINNIIISYINQNNLKYQNLTNDQLMAMLQDLQLLQPLLQQMNSTQNINQINQQNNNPITHKQQFINNNIQLQNYQSTTVSNLSHSSISITIKSGRKFKSFLKLSVKIKSVISVVGFNQKSKTSLINTNSQSFSINEILKFTVYKDELNITNNMPLELALILINTQTNQTQLYAVKMIQWRYLLAYGSATFDIELAPYFIPQHLPQQSQTQAVGILSLQLKLTPMNKYHIITQKSIQNQIQLQNKLKQKYNRQFYQQANDFWLQYKQIHPLFTTRRIKLYANSQDKLFIPLCKLITPLYNLKGIQSPNHALRFISLISFEQQNHIINKNNILYKRYTSMLANKKGNIDDHCNLLCGMLLGFGLKAYVAVGYGSQGEHTWVITKGKDNLVFWESTKGIKFDYFSPKTFKYYKAVHVIYNDKQYYANIQLDDSISGTKFNFNDKNLWKSFNSNILTQITPYNRQLALTSPSLDIYSLQSILQKSLQQKITLLRKSHNLSSTNFDPILTSILTTALTNYQYQRISSLTFCQQQFQQAIKSYIPLNHTFKAFPIQLSTLEIDRIMEELIGQQKCKEILMAKGDSVFFAVRCKVVSMPDNIVAGWVSVAVRYFKLKG